MPHPATPEPTVTPRIVSTREGYDLWAAVYDSDGNPLIALEEPKVATLLGDVRGLKVADIGCGTGRHAIRLAAEGAHVDALDFSDAMLERARAKAGKLDVRFHVHDLAASLPFEHAFFDRVLCALLVDHVADLPFLFREMRRTCKPSGSAVVSVMHPALMLRGVQARFSDPATGQEIRPESQPHQITDYIMAALNAGLRPDHLSEHFVDQDLANRFPRAAKYLGWPMLFLMRLVSREPIVTR